MVIVLAEAARLVEDDFHSSGERDRRGRRQSLP
jgi:hypothetical protein